jgi:DNA-binding PadR family transcriptional regulator
MAGDWPGEWNVAFGRGGPFPRPHHIKRIERHMRGGPPFAFGPMGPPFGGGRGRRRRGDVRAALLRLLAEEPRNGYQLMQAIEERSGGRWRPSPGSVYPALSQLEDEGLIRATERDGAKLYEITDAGRERLGQSDQAAPWEFEDDPAFEAAAGLHSLVRQIFLAAVQVSQAGDDKQIERASEILTETRKALYRILAEEGDA